MLYLTSARGYIRIALGPFFRFEQMTPEERNQAIDFIVASQARLAAAEEQDRELLRRLSDVQTMQANLLNRQTDLIVLQSERMDRMDRRDSALTKNLAKSTALEEEALRLLRQALQMLNMILDRLPPPIR